MKHILLCTLIFCSYARAQDERNSVSAHIGFALSELSYPQDETDFISCYNAGIEVRHKLNTSNFYLQSGIRWNEYGWRQTIHAYIWTDTTYVESFDDYQTTYFYLTVPLIATYKFKKLVPGLTLSAGPQLSIFTFRKAKLSDNVVTAQWYPSRFNLGAYFSLGYEHGIGEKWLLGGEVYSNVLFTLGAYNFGLGISGRYLLNYN